MGQEVFRSSLFEDLSSAVRGIVAHNQARVVRSGFEAKVVMD
jgi:hypothetical protein